MVQWIPVHITFTIRGLCGVSAKLLRLRWAESSGLVTMVLCLLESLTPSLEDCLHGGDEANMNKCMGGQ